MSDLDELGAARPSWRWRNTLAAPSDVVVEPSFKSELGLVFLGIGEHSGLEHRGWSGPHEGIWLDEERAEELITAIRASVRWSKDWAIAWAELES